VSISCSLARNAPLRSFVGLLWSFVGPLRSFAVFSHTGVQSITGLYYMAGVNNAFVSELHNKYFTRQI